MPFLVLVKSPLKPPPFREVELLNEPQVIGRDDKHAQIPIRHDSVSRTHARVWARDGAFYLEDLGSRNKTFVNGREVIPHAPVALRPDDRIRICDFEFQFRDEDDSPSASIEESRDFLASPEERLRALMSLAASPPGSPDLGPLRARIAETLFSSAASRSLDPEALFNQLGDTLLGVFKQADRCMIFRLDEAGRPVLKATRGGGGEARFNRSVVGQTAAAVTSFLGRDTGGPAPRSFMCVPLATSEGRALGAVWVETADDARPFAPVDLNLFGVIANLASVAVERTQLQEKARAQAVVQNQMELAREVQRGFLPHCPPVVEGYEFYSHYHPAQTVGGDCYDFIPLPGGRVAVVLGDVSGKGIPAALLVAKLSSEVRFCLLSEGDAARAMTLLNDQMIRGGLQDRFVTLLAMVLDPAAHRLTVVNAGHMSPRLYSASRGELTEIMTIEQGGLPLGVEAGYEYEALTVNLEPGDTVCAFTDGVNEALNPAGETFGLARVDRFLVPDAAHGEEATRPRWTGERLVCAVRDHAAGRPQNDDIAVVCFGRWEMSRDPGTALTR
jgi:serine phosphatase RsbU (regulator of sigma subunit)